MPNGIYKRGSSFYIRIKMNGVRVRKSYGGDRLAAEVALAEMRKQRALARWTQDWSGLEKLLTPKSRMTLKEAAENYLAEKQLKHSSIVSYQDRLKHLLAEFGDKVISEISEAQIARFQARLTAKLSPARVNAIINLLRFILKTCVRRGLIDSSPAAGVDTVREEQGDIDPLTRAELDLVISKISDHYKPIFTCLAWTGARPGELKALRWSDIDFSRDEISISKARYKGHESTTKTKSSKRVIHMLPPVKTALLAIRNSSQVVNLDRHVFLGKDGEAIDRHLDRTWAVALQKSGLRHRPSYQLRHTFASIMLQEGVPPGWISKQLGHTNLYTTFRHYARYIDDGKRVEQQIAQAFFGVSVAPEIKVAQTGTQSISSATGKQAV